MVSGKLSKWLGGGFLAGFLVALAVLVMAASTPSGFTPWSAFVGTNRIIIRTNAAGNLVQVDGQAIIDSSNSLVAQISAAQVWTNDVSVPELRPVLMPRLVTFRNAASNAWDLFAQVGPNYPQPYALFNPNLNNGNTNDPISGIYLDANSGSDTGLGVAIETDFVLRMRPGDSSNPIMLYSDYSLPGDPTLFYLGRLGDLRAPSLSVSSNNIVSFRADATKTTNATPLDVAGPTTLYGGLQVKNSATLDGGVTIGPSLASLFLGTNWQLVSDSLVPNHDLRLIDNWNLTTPLLVGTNGILTLSNGLSLPTGAGAGKIWTSVDSSGAGSWSNVPASSFTSLLIQTNGVDAGYATNINFPSNATVTISGQTATVGLTASGGGGFTGSTNFINLSVQAGKILTTNYPVFDFGQISWENIFYKTNAEGSIADLGQTWDFTIPPDYATNSLTVHVWSFLEATNGPSSSNSIWRVSLARAAPGDSTDIHTAAFGSTLTGTNTWTASGTGTNKLQDLRIAMSTSSLVKVDDIVTLKLERVGTSDTFGGPLGLSRLRIEYTRP